MAKNALEGLGALDSFLKMGDISTVPNLNGALSEKIGILSKHPKECGDEGLTPEFLKEGRAIGEVLSGAQGAQEKEIKSLPKEAEEYAYQKGLLRQMLKKLNRCGQAAFAADSEKKKRYTFEVLYRKANAPSRPKQEKPA